MADEMKNVSRLKEIISKFDRTKILVIGDLMLDEFIWGDVSRISPEAPVPVVHARRESFMLGGALNVANNIHALGGRVLPCGVIGHDIRGQRLMEELKAKGIGTEGIVVDKGRPTTLKTRIIARHQQVVRVDRETTEAIDHRVLGRILRFLREKISRVNLILIEDYGKGAIVPQLLREVLRLVRQHKKPIAVDPKEDHFSYYRGVTVVTPNHHEAQAATGIKMNDKKSLRKIGRSLLNRLKSKAVLITLGEEGMCLFESSGGITRIPTVAQEVYDVSGAGDTVVSTFSMALAAGADMKEAAHLSNYAAGVVVGKVGIDVVTREELLERIGSISAE